MWTIHSVVLFSLWTLVYGVRVPNEWNEAAETNVNNVRNPVYGYYPSNTQQRAYIDSTPDSFKLQTTLYPPLVSSPNTAESLVLYPVHPQKHSPVYQTQKLQADLPGYASTPLVQTGSSSLLPGYYLQTPLKAPNSPKRNVIKKSVTEAKNPLPPLLNPRYPELQIPTTVQSDYPAGLPEKVITSLNYLQNLARKSDQNTIPTYQSYQVSPSNVVRIKPVLELPVAQTTNRLNLPQQVPYKPKPNSKKPKSQKTKFIVPATEHYSTSPLGFQYKEEPEEVTTKKSRDIFFVPESYSNVRVQGSNKKKKYVDPYSKKESKTVLSKKKLDRPKTSFEYSFPDNYGRDTTSDGSTKNSIKSGSGKTKTYFDIPKKFDKNYRDDTLHEPGTEEDFELDDDEQDGITDESEKIDSISDDDEEEEEEQEEEEEPEPKSEKAEPETKVSDQEDETSEEEEKAPETVNPNEGVVNVEALNEHAEPKPVATQPIYPGPGLWAKPGIKHRPHVTPHKFYNLPEDKGKPDGHDVFDELEQFFEKQKTNFDNNINQPIPKAPVSASNPTPIYNYRVPIKAPKPPNPLVVYDPFNDATHPKSGKIYHSPASIDRTVNPEASGSELNNGESVVDPETATEFVPLRIYTQVRKTEDVAHEPYKPELGRLKAVIKDSKVQTVYSEEGYEDAAYDHAGHEKKAEQDENSAAFEKEKLARGDTKKLKEKEKILEAEVEEDVEEDTEDEQSKVVPLVLDNLDSDTSDTTYPTQATPNHISETPKPSQVNTTSEAPKHDQAKNFVSSEEVTATEVKDKNNGDVQMEIESEVKFVTQPNNSAKAHKYVKIFPKVLKDVTTKEDVDDKKDENETDDDDEEESSSKDTNDDEESSSKDNIDKDDEENEDDFDSSHDYSTEGFSIEEITPGSDYSDNFKDFTIPGFDDSTTESSTVSSIEALTAKTTSTSPLSQTADKPAKNITSDGNSTKHERNKRDADPDSPYEETDIDTDFIDKIKHSFAAATPEPDPDFIKYPYYNKPILDINKDSPIRYAEDLKNIPVKKPGELSFYKLADKMECPEVVPEIDPIPEHVKNARETDEYEDDEGDEKEYPPEPEAPRVILGDKIDCLKLRYFGENPLDSPFFREETIDSPKPIFSDLAKKTTSKSDSAPKSSITTSQINPKLNEIPDQPIKKAEPQVESTVKEKVIDSREPESVTTTEPSTESETLTTIVTPPSENVQAESVHSNQLIVKPLLNKPLEFTTESNLVTLITTPKYTIQLTPNNIYDQIKLLDHLPESEDYGDVRSTTVPVSRKQSESISVPLIKRNDNVDEIIINREAKELNEVENGDDEEDGNINDVVLEPEAWRRSRLPYRRPVYEIFDVNRFLTTTPFTLINTASTTVLPKDKVMSEVFYKEQIKPNEQLNVFADIINNIKNASQAASTPEQSHSDSVEQSSVTISSLEDSIIVPTEPSNIRVRKHPITDSFQQANDIKDSWSPSKVVPNRHPQRRIKRPHLAKKPSTRPSSNKISEASSEDDNRTTRRTAPKIKKNRRRKISTSTTTATPKSTKTLEPHEEATKNHRPYLIDFIEDVEAVVGLVPPSSYQYKTIVSPEEDSDSKGSNRVSQQVYDYRNGIPKTVTEPVEIKPVTEIEEDLPSTRSTFNYYVLGMKPPEKQRARPYSEFASNSVLPNDKLLRRKVAHVGYSRFKRSAARPAYADLSRNRGRQNEGIEKSSDTDDADDYVPHRHKTYHYDEKTGRIIYDNKPKEDKSEEEEYEEIEVSESPGIYLERAEGATHPTPEKVTTKLLLATATPPSKGKGLLDFVSKLKSNPSYKSIPDPTTPKPGAATTITEAFSTPDPKSTNPPEFLSILSKVKSDKNYKIIEDPKESQSKLKPVSTTSEPVSEDDEEEDDDEEADDEEEAEPTPGKPLTRPVRQISNLNIFNVGDFLPKIQTPIESNIPTNFFMTHVVERIFPRLRYMTPYDIAREKYKQTDLYKFVSSLVQNAPGEQSFSGFQIFNIGDYLPTIKPIVPKTAIDYSKYKTIERSHPKVNTDEAEANDSEVVTRPPEDSKPIVRQHVRNRGGRPGIRKEESIDRPVVSTPKSRPQLKSIASAEPKSTTQRIVQLRRGTRFTTPRSTEETTSATTKVVTRRSGTRRKPLPKGFRSTSSPDFGEYSEATEQVERIYPVNQSNESVATSESQSKTKRVYRKRPIRIRHTTERQEEDDATVDRIVRRSLTSNNGGTSEHYDKSYLGYLDEPEVDKIYEEIKEGILGTPPYEFKPDKDKDTSESKKDLVNEKAKDVEIIDQFYDKSQKHGGNYKKLEDPIEVDKPDEVTDAPLEQPDNEEKKKQENSTNIEDIKPLENKTKESAILLINATALSKAIDSVDSLEEETKKLPKAILLNETESLKNVTRPVKSVVTDKPTQATELKQHTDDVKVVNENYDKATKPGSSYTKYEEEEEEEEDYKVDTEDEDVETAADEPYEAEDGEVEKIEETKVEDVAIEGSSKKPTAVVPEPTFNQSKTQDDYKPEEETVLDEPLDAKEDKEEVEEPQPDSDYPEPLEDESEDIIHDIETFDEPTTSTTTQAPKVVPKLSDVAPKPDHYYTDPQLPKEVNKLGSQKVPVTLSSEEIDQIAVEGDVVEERTKPQRRILLRAAKRVNDETEAVKEHTTEGPVFEKDPSKRLYYYVPE